MKGQELRILFEGDMAFLTSQVALNFDQVEISDLTVFFKRPAYWNIQVLNYNQSEHRLYVQVLGYYSGQADFSEEQIQLADILMDIEKVTFKGIDTFGLLRTLNGGISGPKLSSGGNVMFRGETLQTVSLPERDSEPLRFTRTFSIAIKDLKFFPGGVSFLKSFQTLRISLSAGYQMTTLSRSMMLLKITFQMC